MIIVNSNLNPRWKDTDLNKNQNICELVRTLSWLFYPFMKLLKKIFLGLFATAMILAIVYMLGPKVKTQELTIAYPDIPMDAQ